MRLISLANYGTLGAAKLYELGRLSSGRATELAGMPRVEFLVTRGRWHIVPFAAELRTLENVDAASN